LAAVARRGAGERLSSVPNPALRSVVIDGESAPSPTVTVSGGSAPSLAAVAAGFDTTGQNPIGEGV
jgi:hypothetical protein